MRVMVTGGTGFVGGHTVRALVDEGHEPCLLVRSRDKVEQLIELFDLPSDLAWVQGDILDAQSVTAACADAEACIHSAAFTTLDPALMDQCLAINGPGTKLVLDAAVSAGCDPIIHISSISCIFPPIGDTADADVDPVRSSDAPYSQSKVESELYARELQAAGHPVVTVYPGGATGPLDLGQNVMATVLVSQLSSDTLMSAPTGGGGSIDVRDLARALAKLIAPGGGPRRFLAQGPMLPYEKYNALLNDVSGMERAVVSVTREQLLESLLDPEVVEMMLEFRPGNDRPIQQATGVTWRPTRETWHDTIAWLLQAGYLEPRWAPAVANAT